MRLNCDLGGGGTAKRPNGSAVRENDVFIQAVQAEGVKIPMYFVRNGGSFSRVPAARLCTLRAMSGQWQRSAHPYAPAQAWASTRSCERLAHCMQVKLVLDVASGAIIQGEKARVT